MKSASWQTSHGSKPIFKFQTLTPAWKKLTNFSRAQPAVIWAWVAPRGTQRPSPGWTGLRKGVSVVELYPLVPPALPKHYTPPYDCLTEEPLATGSWK